MLASGRRSRADPVRPSGRDRPPLPSTRDPSMKPPPASRRRTNWLILTAAAALAGLTVAPRPALAWGRMGHRAAARLAESRLTPAARAAVKDLLEPGESLADASTWADEVRPDRPESAPWHYVNVPITEPRYSPRFCPDEGCVVRKVG